MRHTAAKAELMRSARHADIVGELIVINSKTPAAVAGQRKSAGYRDVGDVRSRRYGARNVSLTDLVNP